MIGLLYRGADVVRRFLRHDPGRIGEDIAHRFLRRNKCTVVARNYRTRSGSGEIDIVAWHGETLVFVEVKTRGTAEFGDPGMAVDEEKRLRLRRAAYDYTRRAGVLPERTRFDVVSIVLAKPVQVQWVKDAFKLRG